MRPVLVFDLDDTLYAERDYVLGGFSAVGDWLRKTKSITGFSEIAEKHFVDGTRGNIFDLALNNLGITNSPGLVNEMVRVYREHAPKLSLFPDAAWALEFFTGKAKLGLLSDGYLAVQQRKVAALGISSRFDTMVFSDAFGREAWKPSRVPYERVMSVLEHQGTDCVYVADNPAKDFVTAKTLGWYTIQINRANGEYRKITPAPEYRAHCEIQSLRELEALASEI